MNRSAHDHIDAPVSADTVSVPADTLLDVQDLHVHFPLRRRG